MMTIKATTMTLMRKRRTIMATMPAMMAVYSPPPPPLPGSVRDTLALIDTEGSNKSILVEPEVSTGCVGAEDSDDDTAIMIEPVVCILTGAKGGPVVTVAVIETIQNSKINLWNIAAAKCYLQLWVHSVWLKPWSL